MTQPWDAATAAHLFRRAGFGAHRERIDEALEAGRDQTIESLFARREHDPALVRGIRPMLALEDIEPLQSWWMSLILGDGAPLIERIALMWHDHFATSHDKVGDVRLMHGQIELFRRMGLGDFRELLHAVARDPAMLVWLDGNANRRGRPNENFAREVLELFALGIGHYDEHDVLEAARAFTGWGVDGRRFVFREAYHDPGAKSVLGESGDFDGDDVIDLVLAHPACARHIARRLLAEFVLPEPSAQDVEHWASVLVAADWNIERTLAQLLRSELFDSDSARRSRIAGPVELIANTVISFGLRMGPRDAVRAASDMGQALLRPPSVKGWDGGRTWIHAGSWLARHNTLTELALEHGAGRVDAAPALGHPSSKEEVARAVLARAFPEGATPAYTRELEAAASAAADTSEAVRHVLALTLTSPEYHLV
ncbi:MAG: DUF1800 domain-containing protein [bacterium]|nr:DUF1800 domain-containing protein [bacterium]